MLAATVERHGDRSAVVDGDARLTYRELHDEATTFGAALVAAGIQPGDRVSIWAPNGRRWIVAVLGLLRAGAVLVPVNTRFKGAEAADIVARSRARALVTVTDFLDADNLAMLRSFGVDLPDLQTVVVAGGSAPEGAESWDDFLARATAEGRAGRLEEREPLPRHRAGRSNCCSSGPVAGSAFGTGSVSGLEPVLSDSLRRERARRCSPRAESGRVAGGSSKPFPVSLRRSSAEPTKPIVRDEIYKIAAEALRNAFRHAHAGEVEVEHPLRRRAIPIARAPLWQGDRSGGARQPGTE